MAVQTGQLTSKNDSYIFDYDNLFIPTDKYDSKRSYKHADGYFPGIASIGNFPVYIEKPQWQQQREIQAGRNPEKGL